ncbi:glycosyltransferase family 1 protein [Brachybacterium sp. Marseille-Q7125]|uniref:glycosyltransferase family 1 protein n=1 Tax=Brachybacterium sp. Marseille-Q7125 TaxID=2932815 RepID=UPI001FF3AD28|nr:glycosyltransferase family 1 protein [Brachybacterium sp. Marseille-Q7125]
MPASTAADRPAVACSGTVDILAPDIARGGWGPIQAMVHLAVRYFDARLLSPADHPVTRRTKLRLLRPRPRSGGSGGRALLVIAPLPGSLDSVLNLPAQQLAEYSSISAWVIDSFWHERIPRIARAKGWLDRLYVMDADDAEPWRAATKLPVSVLPWGTDTQRAGLGSGPVTVDLLRVGRQSEPWDDDATTALMAREAAVCFHGRPGFGADEAQSQHLLHQALDRSRAVLAFTNLRSPANYTHPTRDYLTGRWTDALAHGCVMVGEVPGSSSARELVPKWAQLTVPADDPRTGLEMVAQARLGWDEALRERIRAHAREKLDWRLRFARIAEDLMMMDDHGSNGRLHG